MRLDQHNIRQGKMFAMEMIAMAPGNLSVQPIIDNLTKSLENKPPAQREGILQVIQFLRAADKPTEKDVEPGFAQLLGSIGTAPQPNEGVMA